MVASLKPYAKSIVGGIGALCVWLAAATAEGGITLPELGALPLAIATAMGVYAIRNTPLHLAPRSGRRHLRADRGAVDMGSLAVGLILGIIAGFLMWAGTSR